MGKDNPHKCYQKVKANTAKISGKINFKAK